MSSKITLGGERVSSGKKMKVELHGYERSTHDLSKAVRTTMAAGTLVPVMDTVALPADTWDIELQAEMMTHPTLGPLFGSYKLDIHVFQAPYRLYNALLHNNMLGIGRDMAQAKLPVIKFTVQEIPTDDFAGIKDLNIIHVNPSCLLWYQGIKGFGIVPEGAGPQEREMDATSILAYWEIVKNYYANKQEEIGAVIHQEIEPLVNTVDTPILIDTNGVVRNVLLAPLSGNWHLQQDSIIKINYTGTVPKPEQIYFNTVEKGWIQLSELADFQAGTDPLEGPYNQRYGVLNVTQWRYRQTTDIIVGEPQITTFPLSNIDDMRYEILATPSKTTAFDIAQLNKAPYKFLYESQEGIPNSLSSQEGLALKCYNSDIFNNWLNTENIEAITQASAIDTSGGYFTIDQLLVGKAVYNLENRINASGGTYDDWLMVVYDHEAITRAESPIYHGGLIKELIFQEVVSNSSTEGQPLGTLAGKGTLSSRQRGGKITIKVDEPSILMAIASITPRLDYSQGNKWHRKLKTVDDLHKPQFDQIGFQDLPTDQMAWWDSYWDTVNDTWTTKSAGKQPAWINYMTEVNEVFGNFAIQDNEMFMVLNRRYDWELDGDKPKIKDLTTYIDPSKFNFIFAETQRDAQNFWLQVGIKATVRRKMSAKIMPNI